MPELIVQVYIFYPIGNWKVALSVAVLRAARGGHFDYLIYTQYHGNIVQLSNESPSRPSTSPPPILEPPWCSNINRYNKLILMAIDKIFVNLYSPFRESWQWHATHCLGRPIHIQPSAVLTAYFLIGIRVYGFLNFTIPPLLRTWLANINNNTVVIFFRV